METDSGEGNEGMWAELRLDEGVPVDAPPSPNPSPSPLMQHSV